MPKVSVIIPIYNTEKYIIKCLDSIVNQTMEEIEIILVNDGSTDQSEEIIKEYMRKQCNQNIKYFKKKNGGLSDARNYGVKQATGKYISFIDSDDYIAIDLYKKLEKYMDQDIEIIKFKMQTVDEKGNIIEKIEGPIFEKCTGEEAFEKLCTIDKYMDPACIYLYKRDFFMKNKFQYEVGTYHEDFGLTSLILVKASSFVSTNEYGYYYLQSNNSITRNDDLRKQLKKAQDVLKHYDNMEKKLEEYDDISNKTKIWVKRYYTNTVIRKAEELKDQKEEFKNYVKEIRKRKMYKNIKPYNIKQLIKRIVLKINIKLYLKMR